MAGLSVFVVACGSIGVSWRGSRPRFSCWTVFAAAELRPRGFAFADRGLSDFALPGGFLDFGMTE
jgi:hypothetical protein